MLTVNPYVGVPHWMKLPDDLPSWERNAHELIAKMNQQKADIRRYGSWDLINQMVEDLKQCGKNCFKNKRYHQAQITYSFALDLAQALANFDVTRSQLYSNVALCWLRLDCPHECMECSRKAIYFNIQNTKAHHHLAASLFMVYEFEEALRHVELILKINPECIELLILKEKILSNGIPGECTQTVIKLRLEQYGGVIFPRIPCIIIPEDRLIGFDLLCGARHFLLESELLINNKIQAIDACMHLKNFSMAYDELIGLHHIYHVRKTKYNECEASVTMFELHYKKAFCLYYMENYKDALNNCELAKELVPRSSVKFLTLESRILCKLKKYDEASALIAKSMKDFRPKGVEELILKEISFTINFEQNQTRTNLLRINPSGSSEIAPKVAQASKGTASTSQQREPSSTNKARAYRCDLCNVDIYGPKGSWNEHLKGRRHRALVEIREESNKIVGASSSQTLKEHLDEDSDDYESAQSDFEIVRSELERRSRSPSEAAPHNKMELSKCQDPLSERVEVVMPSTTDGASESKPNGDANKSGKLTKQDQKSKQTATKSSGKHKKQKVKQCHVCNIPVGSTKELWIEHTKGKIHTKLHEEREARRAALKKELEEMEEDKDDSDDMSEECQDSLERSCSSSEKVSSLIDSEDISEEVRDSDFGSQTTEENDNTFKLIVDRKLKVSEDSWTYPSLKNLKQAKSSKTTQKPTRRRSRSRKSSKNSITSVAAEEKIVVGCNDDCHGNISYMDNLGELQPAVDDGCSETDKWKEVRKDQNKSSGVNKERSFIIGLPPNSVFPLKLDDYNIGLACEACLQKPGSCSNCHENMLVVQKKPEGKWVAIRERTGHGQFYSLYRMCRNLHPCFRGSICSYPHSEEEKTIWNMEKQKLFSIWKFIKMHRSKSASELNGIESICKAFPGLLRFACGECYLKEKSLIGKSENGLYCSNRNGKHNWTKYAMMIHENNFNGSLMPIFPYSSYKMLENVCQDEKYCNKKGEKCLKPHSLLELQIWRFQEENKCSALEFAEKFNELKSIGKKDAPRNVPSVSPPHTIKKICSICWSVKTVSYENPQNGRCTGIAAHPWTYDCLFYIPKAKQRLRHLPRIIPRANDFKICWNVQDKKPCKIDDCQFAHYQEELEIWKWMISSGNHDPGLAAKKFETPANKSSSEEAAMTREAGFISRRPQNPWNVSQLKKVEVFKIAKEEKHYCPFCEKCFSGVRDLEVHRNTSKHMENVKSDACMQWNHRIPPYASKFELCRDHVQGKCYYSNVPDERNYCTFAHGQSELDEWNERTRWKKVKFDSAGRDHLLSAASKFMKAYREADVKSDVMVDRIEGIKITFDGELAFRSTEKNCQHVWLFEIKSERFLKEVYLLKEHSRNNFSLLQEPSGKEKQYIPGALIRPDDSEEPKVYLKFQSKMFGCFSQTVIFDFGGFPVVVKTVKCEVGSHAHLEKLNTIRLNLNLDRWTPLNENIIRYEEFGDASIADVLSKYPPKDVDEIMSDYPVMMPLHKDIYRRKMHGLLYLEELSQSVIISRYNLKTTIELCNVLESEFGGMRRCSEGELYGKISLENQVIEGSLMLKSVRKVLFKPLEGECQDIFEALIPEFDDNLQKNITGESVIILFHAKCFERLNLKAGERLKAEVQFQLDRDSFCRMHYAVDNCDLEFLCPTLQNAEACRSRALKNPELNEKQNKVLVHAFSQGTDFQPPMVVYGPFGTGKTETLAKTSIFLATQRRSETKILICTKSNKTADEYFERYFCDVETERLKAIRIYREDRKLTTVDPKVKDFCLIDQKKEKFRMPTLADIKDNQIFVMTLETSFYLHPLGKGCRFSHIFVDEAGQDLECRTIIPLMLADKKTQIVVVGDHMQLGEEVFNQVARDQRFGSLMERLFDHYEKLKRFREPPLMLFNENYRNQEDILAFISKIYYGNALVSKQVECASEFGPLEFFAVSGKEEVNKESASIYNLLEVEEIIERVSALYDHWPAEWGERCASHILVTSPYIDQIRYVRRGLRMKARGLSGVTVIRVQNVPGMEFRAVFVSTVRTSEKVLSYQYETGCNDEGFLTQPKLLNTVFTRAKSYLAVVGDPVMLCSTGECSKIWIEFLKKCQELNKINPPELTLQEIKDACSSRDYDIGQDNIEDGEVIDDFDDTTWKEGFQLKSDEIIKRLVLEYSSEEVCGFSLTLQESLENGQNNIDPNTLSYISSSNAPKDWQSLPSTEVAHTHRCHIRMNGASKILARPFEPLKFKIIIPTRRLCNTALDGDEVLVRVINPEDIDNPDKIIKGEVVALLKRRIDVEDRQFVCFVDEQNVDIMIPINNKMPLIKIVTSEHAKKTKGHVSIYGITNTRKLLRDVPVICGSRQKQLFLVKLLRWEKHCGLPLGVVISAIKPGTNMHDIMKILDIEYDIPERLGPRPSCAPLDPLGDCNREDCTDMLVFTIDGEETEDIDDAIGFKTLDSDSILLSIHISDVSYYVAAASPLDKEVRQRATSFYPPNGDPIHMLPENYSTDICSLKEGMKRRALSIFMKLDGEGNLASENDVSIKRTFVKSKHRLTYGEVESVLMDDAQLLNRHPHQLIHALREIYKIATKWRWERLGSDAMEWKMDLFATDGPNSRELIAELMIQANKIIARFLLKKFQNCTPLRIQIPPDQSEMDQWKEEFCSIASKSTGLRRFFKTFPDVCRCQGVCGCIIAPHAGNILVPKKLWNEIVLALETQNPSSLRPLVHDLDKLPQAVVANSFLKKLQERSEYICSGDAGFTQKFHYSLNTEAYTHFTSPIRRYIDIVVHRLVIDGIENRRPSLTREEISEICRHCTHVSGVSRDYDKASHNALVCTLLQDRPLRINATVTKIKRDFEIELHSMAWHAAFRTQLSLKPAKLGLIKLPDLAAIPSVSALLSWKQRIYNNPPLFPRSFWRKDLNSSRYFRNVTQVDWGFLMHASNQENFEDEGHPHFSREPIDDEEAIELSSESRQLRNHFCEFSMKLQQSDLVALQVSSKLHRGLLTPYIQMVPITKLTNVCVEHNSDPVQCFSNVPYKLASKNSYASLNEYKQLWRSVLSLEAAQTSIDDGVPAIIHNVLITWDFDEPQNEILGSFQLDKYFCRARGLKYFADEEENELQDVMATKSRIDSCSAYICIQYSGVVLGSDDVDRKMKNIVNESHPVTLTFHCLLLKATLIPGSTLIQFAFKLMQHSSKFTNEVRESVARKCATIEWIEQSLPMRRMIESLEKLTYCSELSSKIVLKQFIPRPVSSSDVALTWPDNKRPPNSIQEEAIKMAMNSSFSLIQGPPGTGKTFVMAQLVNQFYVLNMNSLDQVMCCGPSNKSVDVIATALLDLNPKMEILRIYGQSKENKCYPLPCLTSFVKEKVQLQDEKTDERLRDYTLHHLIRNEKKCVYAKTILELEGALTMGPNFMNQVNNDDNGNVDKSFEGMLTRYKNLKKNAEKFFIERAKVIVITCTGIGAGKLKDYCIKQLLIDECGMCTEPESLVPIVGTLAKHVVLIGDHKQLRPIIMNKAAAKLGLETSLFQRYNEQAFMLTKQYRMHEAIAEFPSKQFYQGKLTTGRDSQRRPSQFDFWPGGRNRPMAFVHLGGSEESLVNSSEEGGLQSKKNLEQAQLAVKIAFNLYHHHKVDQKDIIILSQYRSQCTEILKLLRSRNLEKISVSTVISAQGSERKFVILSTVRTMPSSEIERTPSKSWKEKHLGFVIDPHQINVALTRAEEGLIILGNKELLSVDKMWKDLVDHYEERNALVVAHSFALLRR